MGNPGGEGVLEGLDFFVEQLRFVEFAGEFAGEIAGGADGAHPQGGVGVFQGVGEGDYGPEGDFLELEPGELAGLIGLLGQFWRNSSSFSQRWRVRRLTRDMRAAAATELAPAKMGIVARWRGVRGSFLLAWEFCVAWAFCDIVCHGASVAI